MFPPDDTDISEVRLREVDKVLELIKDLSSKDCNISEDAVKRADEYLKKGKTGFSKTLINKSDLNSANMGNSTDVASFMDAVEKDASERAKRRARQRARANKLKERANTFFKAGDWHRAIDLYTQAIEVCKDWEVLYTNRAQAYLRSGEPAAALQDCDTALSLLSFHRSPSTSKSDHGDSIQPDPLVAKTHFHRGKALMALERPDEALCAYTQSRAYSSGSYSSQQKWPAYLMEYVAQAETAVAAKQVDAEAEADFEARVIRSESINNGPDSTPAGTQLVGLLAKLARADQQSTYYSVGLRQLTRLLSSAPRVERVPQLETAEHAVPQKTFLNGKRQHLDEPPPSQVNRRERPSKGSAQSNTTRPPESKDVPNEPALTEQSQETLSDLQTLFRVKKGFSLLNKEVAAIRRSLNMPVCSENQQPVTTRPSSTESASASVACTDRLLALLNLTNLLTIDCGENQRILVEQHPQLIDFALKCMALTPDFCRLLVEPALPQSNEDSLIQSSINQLKRHKLEGLREASSNLLVTLTSSPSGRQALLNAVGSSPLLDSLAMCLAESFGQDSSLNKNSRCKQNTSVRDAKGAAVSSSATSAVCAAKAAQILENLTQSPGFLLSARSSVASLESLLSVIEAALSVSGRAGRSITTTARCLADLLDGLSTACHDATLRTNLLQCRQPLLASLADCLLRHAPLSTDSGHALLVSSACRLLHNIFVGSLNQTHGTQSLSTCLNSGGLVDTLLAGVGAVLDQPGHGPELRAVAIALAGRLLPLCSGQRILSWLGEPDSITEKAPSDTNGLRTPTERSRLLLAILDSCSLPTYKDKSSHSTNSPTRETSSTDTADSCHEQNQLSASMLGGCIRCLAAATTHSVLMRYMIGDDRRRARRLARIIRAKMPAATDRPPKTTNILSNPTVPRDECLAGNACLILQHCCDDTPLAEHLQGTSVILDLLQLIQESRQLETKRNAAIVVGKLAQANHAHRDELSRLDGWSVLTPFNSWSSSLGRM